MYFHTLLSACSFHNTTSRNGALGAYWHEDGMKISGGTFDANTAASGAGFGGALSLWSTGTTSGKMGAIIVDVENTVFVNNEARHMGGVELCLCRFRSFEIGFSGAVCEGVSGGYRFENEHPPPPPTHPPTRGSPPRTRRHATG